MSIQYCVAATLATGKIEEANYRLLNDPEVARLVKIMSLESDAEFTANYPAAQGAEVTLTMRDGATHQRRLRDLVPSSPDQIRARFPSPSPLLDFIDTLEAQTDIANLFTHL